MNTATIKDYLAANSAYLYFTPEQRENSEYLEFFEKNVVPTMDAILESYARPNNPTR